MILVLLLLELHPEVFGLYCQMYIDVTKFINSSKFDVKDLSF